MKSLLVFALSAIALSAVAAPLRFLSFNIWGDYFKNPVEERQAGVESVILGHKPDLVSLQEVTPNWWASPLFANMKAAGIETLRGDETNALLRAGAPKDFSKWPKSYVNHEPLCYNAKRLKVLDQGLDFYHLHLQAEKSVTWAVFEDRTDGRSWRKRTAGSGCGVRCEVRPPYARDPADPERRGDSVEVVDRADGPREVEHV